jgi:putative hydrolase of the HAD superfamily
MDHGLDVDAVEALLESSIRARGFGRGVFVEALHATALEFGVLDALHGRTGDSIERLLAFAMEFSDGFSAFAEQLKASELDVYLYTKGREEEQMRKVRALALEPLFKKIFVVPQKGPDILSQVLHDIRSQPGPGARSLRTVMIGNSPRDDVGPAVALGIEAIYFNPRWNPRRKEPLPAHGFVEMVDWQEIRKHLSL